MDFYILVPITFALCYNTDKVFITNCCFLQIGRVIRVENLSNTKEVFFIYNEIFEHYEDKFIIHIRCFKWHNT